MAEEGKQGFSSRRTAPLPACSKIEQMYFKRLKKSFKMSLYKEDQSTVRGSTEVLTNHGKGLEAVLVIPRASDVLRVNA